MEALNNKEDKDYLKEKNVIQIKRGCCSKKTEEVMETAILDKTITKLASLLAMGLGENGSNILAKSLKDNLEQEINPLSDGQKIVAIYSFCEIQDYYEIFRILNEDYLIFLNDLAEIIHEIAEENFGLADKNLGNAFSLVWNIDEEFTNISSENGELEEMRCEFVSQLTDAAVITALKIIMEIHTTGKLTKVQFFLFA